ncbi:MAG TPA: PLP-dependent lyase/thiolase [bacterium]|nr:PLP-dependent lyase/thiolase [bacterium]
MTNYWLYDFQPSISKQYQLDLCQGQTPLDISPTSITKLTNFKKLLFKREDQNPHGSFKDRALAYQISYLHSIQSSFCVLSSSGNAAISCCAFAQKTNIKPIILVSPQIDPGKLSQIIRYQPFLLIKSAQAKRLANYIHAKYHIPILNPTKDDHAALGFETLGQEIYTQNPDCEAIFSYSTSGASLLGIFNFYQKNHLPLPRLFAAQISYSASTAISFYHFAQAKQITNAIQQSNGQYQFVSQATASQIHHLLKKNLINSSIEGAAATQLAIQISQAQADIHNAVIVVSGTEHQLINNPDYPIRELQTKSDIDRLFQQQKIE